MDNSLHLETKKQTTQFLKYRKFFTEIAWKAFENKDSSMTKSKGIRDFLFDSFLETMKNSSNTIKNTHNN